MNPADLANWKCICGKGPSISHQVNGYCPYKEGYAQAIEDAAKVVFEKYWAAKGESELAEIWLGNQVRALLARGSR